jgi:hypothetical protein
MNGISPGSNVFYLPVAPPRAAAPLVKPLSRARRLRNLRWHLRLTVSALWAVVVAPRPLADPPAVVTDPGGGRRRIPGPGPAVVIDFATARDRRRPVPHD